MPGYRFFILGAGFSSPAGLPLGPQLWQEIKERATDLGPPASHFEYDLDSYIRYRQECDGLALSEDEVNFEEFLAFLDLEHFLGLRGSDSWSDDGNETQIIIKTLIGEILSDLTPSRGCLPELYYEFARGLGRGDFVLTFNYDTLLERALERVGTPFRLFPTRYEEIHGFSGTVDTSRGEVAILKLHGSIDWFDRTSYSDRETAYKHYGAPGAPSHPVFGPDSRVIPSPLLEGPQFPDDPLQDMYRVPDIEMLYGRSILFRATPWLISPSIAKVVYARKLKSFWWDLGRSGAWNLGVIVIGYSLPQQDDYARHAIYRIVKNYQGFSWEEDFAGQRKRPVFLIDYRPDSAGADKYRRKYSFVDSAKAQYHLGGFDEEAIRLIHSS